MPRRKRNRRHRKHNHRNHFGDTELSKLQDDPMRTYTALETPPAAKPQITEALGFKTRQQTPSPDLEFIKRRSRSPFGLYSSPVRKRSLSRNCMGYSALPFMFNSESLRPCQSSIVLEPQPLSRTKIRSSSSMAKLHSPGTEKIPLKAETGTQTSSANDLIMETPRVNQEDLLDLEYEINPIRRTPLSGYGTPLKRMRLNGNLTPIFDLQDTAERIQDLNNFQNEHTERRALNCSRVLSVDSLKRLQNFNELILNTSQSVDCDNCESDHGQEEAEVQIEAPDLNIDVSGEISFFTPQLYNGKSASTPIEKKEAAKTSEVVPVKPRIYENKIQIVRQEAIDQDSPLEEKQTVAVSTQAPTPPCNVGVQTMSFEVRVTPVLKIRASKEKSFTVSKRRSYKSLSPAIMYYKPSPKRDLRVSPIRRVSLERSDGADTIAAIALCTRIIAKVKKYHGKYSSKLPAKILEICTWLGITIKKGVTSLYKLYTEQKALNDSTIDLQCGMCNVYRTQISALTATMGELASEISHMKQDYQEKAAGLASLRAEVAQLRRELTQFEDLKTEIKEIKERAATKPVAAAPPPPPPPPLPLVLPNNPLLLNKPSKTAAKKKPVDNARPIISLDDILKVKLKKIGDRPSPLQRRATDPLVHPSLLKQVKLRPTSSRAQTPSSQESFSATSSLSNSPCSSLTRMLTGVDSNVRRVKRLKRANAYSFVDFSRRCRRERDCSET